MKNQTHSNESIAIAFENAIYCRNRYKLADKETPSDLKKEWWATAKRWIGMCRSNRLFNIIAHS